MAKKIAIAVLVLIVGFLVLVALQPREFRITRNAEMSASPAAVFAQVNDLHKWEAWSPWIKLDPAAKNTYEGSAAGTGAIFRWAGNNDVGEGSMTITESRPNELIQFKLDFLKPMASTCLSEFSFKAEGDKTRVSWSMTGQNNFIAKAMCLFMNMDKMVGGSFEQGLATLKKIVESPASKP